MNLIGWVSRFARFTPLSALLIAIAPMTLLAPAWALASTCPNNFCSGSDSGTGINAQGSTALQIYFGEVGIYYIDRGGGTGPCPSDPGHGVCFNTTAASNADAKHSNNTGLGAEFYYFGGGWGSPYAPPWKTPYCWGWVQANYAAQDAHTYFSSYEANSWYMVMDVEGNSTYGWNNTLQAQNQQVLNGFQDFIEGKSSADSNCTWTNSILDYQPAVYSAPAQWSYSFGSWTIPNWPEWTYESCCTSTYPGNLSTAQWFGGSHYGIGQQFDQNPDYDISQEPQYMPYWGFSLGT
jgi:hypothetical protein